MNVKKINIHSRQRKILSILNARHGIITGKELSAKIGVSERTIRSDIGGMNDCLVKYGIRIVPVHGKGYKLSIQDRAVFLELFSEKESYVTKEDRIRTLILRLLREDDWCSIGELEDEMFVSHTTIEKDIKGISRSVSLQHPFLKIERRGDYVKFENDERKRRELFTRFYVENWDYDSKEGIVLSHTEIGSEIIQNIQSTLKRRLMESKAYLDDYAFIYLTLAIYVLFVRVKSGYLVESDAKGENHIDEDIKAVLDVLNTSWKLSLHDSEYVYLSEIKEQLVFLSERTYSKNRVLLKTDAAYHHIVDELLEELLKEYGVDFTTDDKLFVDLTRHVQAVKSGIIATSIQNHVLGDELRKKYPFLGDVAHAMRKKMSQKCEVELGVEEEDYLLPFLILAEEELYKKRRGKGIPTAVISHYNESMTRYLTELLKTHYGTMLDLRGPYAIHVKELINQDETMLVLTTVLMQSFDKIFKVPVLTISPLIDEKDRSSIDLYLSSIKSSYLYRTPERQMEHYFPGELCYRMDSAGNLLTAMNEVIARMKKVSGISDIPKIDMAEDYYCILSNGFMFCYVTNNAADETIVSLVDFGKEISCKNVRNIKTLMYMVMPEREKHTLGWFYYIAMALSQHPDELRDVFEGKSLEDLTINISRNI